MFDALLEDPVEGTVQQYPYRTARVKPGSVVAKFPRVLLKDLEHELARQAGEHTDNHTVYKVENRGRIAFLWFHDMHVWVGTEIEEGSY